MTRSSASASDAERGRETNLIYPVLLIAGFAGLVVMAMMGLLHGSHHHGHEGHGHHGHGHAGLQHGHGDHGHALPAHGPAHTALPGQTGHGHAHGHDGSQGDGDVDGDGDGDVQSPGVSALMWMMPLLSPLNWFSWAIGAGAVGLLLTSLGLPAPAVATASVIGALGFNLAVVKPVWRLVFSFASEPAGNLEACIMQTVEAITPFNDRGEGLVRVTIDGRSEDVLARLVTKELGSGSRVHRGEQLLIEEVDPATNTCRVSRA